MANTMFERFRRCAIGGLVVAALTAAPSYAGDGHDHDRARQALEAGEILPLRTILDQVDRDYPGQIMEVELEQKGERWIYEVKVLRTGGALVKLKFDGRSGNVMGASERNNK